MEIKEKSHKLFEPALPPITISTTVSPDFWRIAKANQIKWSEAIRVGLSILFAEKGIAEYDNRLNLYRKMDLFRKKAEDYAQQVEDLKIKLAIKENEKKV